ncbi:TPA: insulinase family protein [Klebsiella pneumoniae]|nr:insulinase family protein [Klebsiella pneumoniae]
MNESTAPDLAAALPDIAFQRFTLDNGLTLLVHEDAASPTVAVHVTYGVGAKNESTGQFGLAHLMEHLMFSGTAALPGSYITHLERAGAEGLNGVTSADTTQFFQSVPPGSLDFTLFAESDRMGHLADGLQPQALDVQREVVTREMEENELQPLGAVQGAILRHLFPSDHPYAHKVAGERADLQQVSFTDVQAWSRRFYRPDSAVIVLAGAISTQDALEKVTQWFGALTPGAPREARQRWVPALQHERRVKLQDHIDHRLLRLCWVIPPYAEDETIALELFAGVLADTVWSPLVTRLMVDNTLATEVSAFIEPGMLASYFNLRIELQPGVDPAAVERHAQEALDEMLTSTLNPDLLVQSQQLILQNLLASWSDTLSLAAELGRHELSPARAEGLRQRAVRLLSISADAVVDAARRWLHQGRLVLQVDPITAASPLYADPARRPPAITLAPLALLTPRQHRVLSNGLRIVAMPAEQPGLLSASLIVDAGSQHDPLDQAGLAQLVAGLVATGETEGAALEQWLASLEAGIALDVGAGSVALRLQTPEHHAERVLSLLTEILRGEIASDNSVTAHRDHYLQNLPGIDPVSWALPVMTFPTDHPLRKPAFTQGHAASLARLTPQSAGDFYRRHYHPHRATLLVYSPLPIAQLAALLESTLAQWQPAASVSAPAATSAPVAASASAPHASGSLMLIERPRSAVTTLTVYFALPGSGSPHDAAVQATHPLLAASFASRINFALREVDRLTYNVVPLQQKLPGSRLLGFEMAVATESTLAAVRAICRECRDLSASRPLTEEELQGLVQMEQLRLSRPQTSDYDRLCREEGLLRNGLPEDYWQRLSDSLAALSVVDMAPLLRESIDPARAAWVVQGAVEPFARELSTLLALPAARFPAQPDALYE